MITCKQFPGKTFNSKEEVFKHLRENVSKIIAVKKATIHKSFENGCVFSGFLLKEDGNIGKVGPQMKEDYIYPVINTTRYLDMHDDAHFDGIWNKSVKEQNGKIFYVTDHETKIDSIIAWPEDVNVMVKSVPWSFVGKDYQGNTEALIYEIPKDKLVHEGAKKIIEDKRPGQDSVRMQYVTIKLAMNSTAKEDITYKEYYDKRINEIANKDVAEAQGYFFGIEEGKIVTEGSMVIRGSNDATPIRQKDTVAVDDTTEKIEPPVGTQAKQSIFSNLKLVR